MLDFDLSHVESIVGQNCPIERRWDNFVPGETVLSQGGRFASYTDPVHSTKLSQLGPNCPNKSAWDNFVHGEVYKDIFVHSDVGLRLTCWLACIPPHKPAISNVYICRLCNGSGLLPVLLKKSTT